MIKLEETSSRLLVHQLSGRTDKCALALGASGTETSSPIKLAMPTLVRNYNMSGMQNLLLNYFLNSWTLCLRIWHARSSLQSYH